MWSFWVQKEQYYKRETFSKIYDNQRNLNLNFSNAMILVIYVISKIVQNLFVV